MVAANNNLASAEALAEPTTSGYIVEFDSTGATFEAGEDLSAYGTGSLWWTVTLTTTNYVRFEVTTDAGDAVWAVYSGTPSSGTRVSLGSESLVPGPVRPPAVLLAGGVTHYVTVASTGSPGQLTVIPYGWSEYLAPGPVQVSVLDRANSKVVTSSGSVTPLSVGSAARYQESTVSVPNLLTANQSGLESGTTTGWSGLADPADGVVWTFVDVASAAHPLGTSGTTGFAPSAMDQGTYSLVTWHASGTNFHYVTSGGTSGFAATPGAVYNLSSRVYYSYLTVLLYGSLRWFNSSGAFLSQSDATRVVWRQDDGTTGVTGMLGAGPNYFQPPTDQWFSVGFSGIVAPAGAAYGQVYFHTTGNTSTPFHLWHDRVGVYQTAHTGPIIVLAPGSASLTDATITELHYKVDRTLAVTGTTPPPYGDLDPGGVGDVFTAIPGTTDYVEWESGPSFISGAVGFMQFVPDIGPGVDIDSAPGFSPFVEHGSPTVGLTNLLTTNQWGLESGTTTGWVTGDPANTDLYADTGHAYEGTYALAMDRHTSGPGYAIGTLLAVTSPGTAGFRVRPGRAYNFSFRAWSFDTTDQVRSGIFFYDADGLPLRSLDYSNYLEQPLNNAVWTDYTAYDLASPASDGSFIAPDNAVYGAAFLLITHLDVFGRRDWFDQMGVYEYAGRAPIFIAPGTVDTSYETEWSTEFNVMPYSGDTVTWQAPTTTADIMVEAVYPTGGPGFTRGGSVTMGDVGGVLDAFGKGWFAVVPDAGFSDKTWITDNNSVNVTQPVQLPRYRYWGRLPVADVPQAAEVQGSSWVAGRRGFK